MALQDYLGVMALGLNDQQHGETTKLSSPDPHMLAAYCFDLTRKQHYLYMALRMSEGASFSYEGSPLESPNALAHAIYLDTQYVEDAAERRRREMGADWNSASDWEARAYAMQDVIIRQWRVIVDDHRRLFKQLGQPTPSYTPAPGAGESQPPSSAN